MFSVKGQIVNILGCSSHVALLFHILIYLFAYLFTPHCLWTLEAAQVFSPSSSTHLLISSTLKQRAIFHQGFPEPHCVLENK